MAERTLVCPLCGNSFTTTNSRKVCCSRSCTALRNREIQGAKKRKRYEQQPCPHCGAPFTRVRWDSTHCSVNCKRRAEYVPRVKPDHQKRCEHCGQAFASKRSDALFCSQRCSKRHRKGTPPVRLCEGCGEDITSRMGNARYCEPCYVDRVKVHEEKRARPATCATCGSEFTAKTSQQKHCSYRCAGVNSRARQLAVERSIECVACGKPFTCADGRVVGCSVACKQWAKKYPGISRNLARQCRTCDRPFVARTMAQYFCTSACNDAYGKDLRRARMAGLPAEPISRTEILARDGMVCHICGEAITDDPSLDHLIPISKPGSPGHVWENVAVAHLRCNVSKGNRVRQQDIDLYRKLREARLQRG